MVMMPDDEHWDMTEISGNTKHEHTSESDDTIHCGGEVRLSVEPKRGVLPKSDQNLFQKQQLSYETVQG